MALPIITGKAFVPNVGDNAVRFGNDGSAFGSVRGKFARRFQDQQGNWQDKDETWVDLQFGDNIQRFVNEFQGNETVDIVGEFYLREYTTKEGQNRQSASIRVKAFEFDRFKRKQQGGQQNQQNQQNQQQGGGGFGGQQGQQQGNGGFGGNQQQGGGWGAPQQNDSWGQPQGGQPQGGGWG